MRKTALDLLVEEFAQEQEGQLAETAPGNSFLGTAGVKATPGLVERAVSQNIQHSYQKEPAKPAKPLVVLLETSPWTMHECGCGWSPYRGQRHVVQHTPWAEGLRVPSSLWQQKEVFDGQQGLVIRACGAAPGRNFA